MSIRTDDLGFVFYEADEQEEKELEYKYENGLRELIYLGCVSW